MADYYSYDTCMGDIVVMRRDYPSYTSPSHEVARVSTHKEAKRMIKEIRKEEARLAARRSARM